MEKIYYFYIKDKQKCLVLQGIVALVHKHIDFSNAASAPQVELLKVSIRQLFYKTKTLFRQRFLRKLYQKG